MKLLFVTQALDQDDPVLSAYHEWVAALAPYFTSIEAVCLKEGRHALPANVRVHTLGKEGGGFSLLYALRFLALIWQLRPEYDAVFVHMNEEYVLLGGFWWKLWGKRAYLWRNHHAGSFLTDIASSFCDTVFCTSKHSYTARFSNAQLMPVGVNTERFSRLRTVPRPNSILFFSRMSPAKRPELLIDALMLVQERGISFSATFAGSPLPRYERYYEGLKERAAPLAQAITFRPGVPNAQAPALFRAHEVFVNCSPSGMYDKMLFEAAACGDLVLSTSDDWKELAGEEFYAGATPEALAERIESLLALSEEETEQRRTALVARAVAPNTLSALAKSLAACMID